MRKLKLLIAACALMVGVTSANAQTDVTASYIGDVTWIVNGGGHNHNSSNHKESDGIGWWNNQTLPEAWHAFAAPNATGGVGESWTPGFGSAGVMMGRTMVLPAGKYTLTFEAFACNATNSVDNTVMPTAGDAVAFLTGKDDVDITNTASAGDATFHNVSYTFEVTTDNTAYEFGIKKLTDDSKVDWCQIKNVKLTLNSTDIFPVANNSIDAFTYTGSQTWHTNHWSTEGQWDGSRFQVYFHELWVGSGGKLDDATISGTYTPTETGVYKVSAWVRAANEAGGDVTGLKIFVGDAETDACSGTSVMGGKARLGTYTAMADGVSGTPFSYGFKIKDATINWLAFKNVVITYLGSLPEAEVSALISQAEALESQEMDADIKSALTTAKNNLSSTGSVANYNALVAAISNAQTSADAYALFAPEKAKALALGMVETDIKALAPDVNALKVAEYNFVTNNYAHAVNLGTWTTENAVDRSGQHWDGTSTSTYSEQNVGYFDNTWSCSYSQNLSLPAGKYVFKVAGRKSSDAAVLELTVKNGTTVLGSVNDFPNGDTGKGIDTSGAANFGDGTFANNNNGRGWQWRYVAFKLDEPATVNIAVSGSVEDAKNQWVGFCNATVQTDNADNVALMEALVALNSAKTKATLTKNENNIGDDVFQFNAENNNTLWNNYETAKNNAEEFSLTSSSTPNDVNALAEALETAIANYQNQPLNAPDADKRYNLTIVEEGKAWNGNAVTFIAAGRTDQGNYGVKYLAPVNANLNQALKFTAVEGEANTYKISAIRVENGREQYLTTVAAYEEGNDYIRIRTTDNADQAMKIKVEATATEGQFQLRNVAANKIIANNNNDDMYTANSANFTIDEASKASVEVNIAENVKYATAIFPFTPNLSGVTFYSCAAAEGNTLTLVQVETPEANKPYILEATAAVNQTLEEWGTAASEAITADWLTGVFAETDAPVGSYVLQNLNDVVGFYKVAEGENNQPKVGANHAYMTIPATEPEARALYFDNATAIKAIEALTSGESEIYDAAGVRQTGLQKGVNIVKKGGKSFKVMVK